MEKVKKLDNRKLSLVLKPFEIRSFRADPNALIFHAETNVPQDMIDYIHNRISFAQKLKESIKPGAIPEGEMKAYDHALATAWKALEEKKYWRARSVLRSAPMMRVYELTASMPKGQIVGKFPNLMREATNMGHWNLLEPMILGDKLAALATGKKQIADSNSFNPEWGGYKVLKANGGKLNLTIDVPASGTYTLQLGLVAKDAAPVIVESRR